MRSKHNHHRPSHAGARAIALGAAVMALPLAQALAAEVTIPPVTVGGGMRTSFQHFEESNSDISSNDFSLNSARLYISGGVTENIKFTFNTEYTGEFLSSPGVLSPDANELIVMDAIARFEFSPTFNIWAGRFLPPSDRANLYGPYYANHWGVYQDGVQDGFPSVAVGRNDGVAYWGQFGIVKVSAGVFDVPSTAGPSPASQNELLWAGRVQVDLWDPEDGYFLNSTYYGDKDLLAFGLAAQKVGDDNAITFDGLMEKKLGNAGVVTLEAEYAKYDGLGGYAGNESDGYYLLAAYVFPTEVGIGKFQVLAKHAKADYEFSTSALDYTQTTDELNVNYLIKQFNARVGVFYIKTDYDDPFDDKQYGIGLQLQM